MTDGGGPFHFGGPLGLGALVAVVGAAGAFVYSNQSSKTNTEVSKPAAVAYEVTPETIADSKPASEQTGTDYIDAADTVLVSDETDVVKKTKPDPVVRPATETVGKPVRPKSPAIVAPSKPAPQIKVIPAQAEGAEVVFIVRIKGSEDINQAARLFRKDPDSAQRAFKKYVESAAPALEDFKLVGGSYSGEIQLAYSLPPGKAPDRAAVNKIKEIIMSVDGVSYADPDFVVHPGKE